MTWLSYVLSVVMFAVTVAVPLPPFQKAKVLPFGVKAARFIRRPVKDDKRINILEGSVRSAKTWALLGKFLKLCAYPVDGHRVLTGVSKLTIYNNILDDLFEILGPKNYTYNRQTGELNVMGVKWLVIGAKDEGSEKYVRGLTVGIAYADELVLLPPSFVRMLLNRMSPAGARFYATTNPDTPFHYVRTDLLDNAELKANGSLWTEHYDIYDNPNISGLSDATPEGKQANDEYRAHLAAMYKGVYYDRFVLGLWVVAQGSIYKDAWSEKYIYTRATQAKGFGTPGTYAERYIGVDCGVDHPQVYLDCIDDGKTLWFDRQYRWDSNFERSQKSDSQYADDLEKFLLKAKDAQVIVPPECASFEAELNVRGIWQCTADNEVLDGIKNVSSMMALGLVRVRVEPQCKGQDRCVCGTECCCSLAKQIPTYVWDEKAKKRGVEQPLKQNDDDVDAKRYIVKTKIAAWRMVATA